MEILTDPLTWLVTLARQLSSVASMVQLHSIALIFSHVACSPTYESKVVGPSSRDHTCGHKCSDAVE